MNNQMTIIKQFENSERLVKITRLFDNLYIVSIVFEDGVEYARTYKSKFHSQLAFSNYCDYPKNVIVDRKGIL